MKKLVALLLSALLALSAVSALAEVTLKLGIYPEDIDTAEVAAHEVFMAEYAKLHPDVVIEKAHYKYATDTFVPMAEAGTLPTIFQSWYTEPQKLIKGQYIADITEAMEARGWADKMNPSIRQLLSSEDGRLYGLPRDGYALGLMINVEVFEDAGLVDEKGYPLYPKTWDELITVGQKIKEETGSAALCLLAKDNAGGWHFSNIAWSFGATFEVQGADGKWTAQVNSPEAVAAMNYVKDLKWKYDLLTPDPTSEDWGTGFAQLGTGSAAMYIGANDAVSQPTATNGLAVDKLMLVGVPAGPGGQFCLSGGTPYFFANNATPEEINAGLDYLEVMGRAPVLTDTVRNGLIEDAKYRVEHGIPVIKNFLAWTDPDFLAETEKIVNEYANVDAALFSHYFDAISTEGVLRLEEPIDAQTLYAELTKVLQAVLTDENADVQALMDTAQANVQKNLDDNFNK